MSIDPYDPMLVNRLCEIIDEGWTVAVVPFIDERRAGDQLRARYGYPKPDVLGTLRRAGVLIGPGESGEYHVDTKKVSQMCDYLADKLSGAPEKVLLKRTVGLIPD